MHVQLYMIGQKRERFREREITNWILQVSLPVISLNESMPQIKRVVGDVKSAVSSFIFHDLRLSPLYKEMYIFVQYIILLYKIVYSRAYKLKRF